MDESLKSLQADPKIVEAHLHATKNLVDTKNMNALINDGQVGSIMVNEADKESAQSRLGSRGITIYGNTKVPRGMAAVYDKSEPAKMLGFFALAA